MPPSTATKNPKPTKKVTLAASKASSRTSTRPRRRDDGEKASRGDEDATDTLLDPPTFRLPADLMNRLTHPNDLVGASSPSDTDRYELWTVRLPPHVRISDLQGVQLPLDWLQLPDASTTTTPASRAATASRTSSAMTPGQFQAQHNQQLYTLQPGDEVENEMFRLLLPKSTPTSATTSSASATINGGNNHIVDKVEDADEEMEHDEDDGEEDEEKQGPGRRENGTNLRTAIPPSPGRSTDGSLYASTIPFHRHWRVVMVPAPVAESAPAQAARAELRYAYGPVPQRTNLKRRWAPPGASAQPTPEMLTAIRSSNRSFPPNPHLRKNVPSKETDTQHKTINSPPWMPPTLAVDGLEEDERAKKRAKKEAKKAKKAEKKASKEKKERKKKND